MVYSSRFQVCALRIATKVHTFSTSTLAAQPAGRAVEQMFDFSGTLRSLKGSLQNRRMILSHIAELIRARLTVYFLFTPPFAANTREYCGWIITAIYSFYSCRCSGGFFMRLQRRKVFLSERRTSCRVWSVRPRKSAWNFSLYTYYIT